MSLCDASTTLDSGTFWLASLVRRLLNRGTADIAAHGGNNETKSATWLYADRADDRGRDYRHSGSGGYPGLSRLHRALASFGGGEPDGFGQDAVCRVLLRQRGVAVEHRGRHGQHVGQVHAVRSEEHTSEL